MHLRTLGERSAAPTSPGGADLLAPKPTFTVRGHAWPAVRRPCWAPPRFNCQASGSQHAGVSLQDKAAIQHQDVPRLEADSTLQTRRSLSLSAVDATGGTAGSGSWLVAAAGVACAPTISAFDSSSSGSDVDDSGAVQTQPSDMPNYYTADTNGGNGTQPVSSSRSSQGAMGGGSAPTQGLSAANSLNHRPQHARTAGWHETAEQLRAAAAVAAEMGADAIAAGSNSNAAGSAPATATAAAAAAAATVSSTSNTSYPTQTTAPRPAPVPTLFPEPEHGPHPQPEPEPDPGLAAAAAAPHPAAAADWLQRTRLLLGPEGLDKLESARVLVVGLGGVGSYVAEFLVRAGVGHLAIVDGDVVDVTNKNRQLPALDSTVGQPKAQVVAQRLLDINPQLNLVVRQEFLLPDSAGLTLLGEVAAQLEAQRQQRLRQEQEQRQQLGQEGQEGQEAAAAGAEAAASNGDGRSPPALDWVVDCIDSIAPKLALVAAAHRSGAQIISSMGAGGRMDPLSVHVADISETYGDSFAAHVRKGLRKTYGISSGVACVFSTEPCRKTSLALSPGALKGYKKSYYGTISFLPAIFGLHIAAHILNVIVDGPMLQTERKQRAKLRAEREKGTPAASKVPGAGAAARRREKRQQQQQPASPRPSRSQQQQQQQQQQQEEAESLGSGGSTAPGSAAAFEDVARKKQQVAPMAPEQAAIRRSPPAAPVLPPSSWLDAVRAGDGSEGFGI
ncbi:hypothetical protein HYH02_013882 [Chlamydomonas schloesseri]|uniref:THIF-type NAD/FAD binding fold domain-containing protein n=1 Tax=Chlamydomonas schloesseri TaxID=2026947 RepID=A0A835SQG0_9CHLO|nr:hypothetical protein HYH02_013882 [Chlamydomonas schloesseri]|eukprot:KAG2429931.1 hypothetical protein HYH02_013882 [Chlamydomonas schloesseri]